MARLLAGESHGSGAIKGGEEHVEQNYEDDYLTLRCPLHGQEAWLILPLKLLRGHNVVSDVGSRTRL